MSGRIGRLIASSLLGVLALTALAAGMAGLVYGAEAARQTAIVLAPLGLVTMLVAGGLTAGRARIGGLRRQFAVAAVVAVGTLLAATGLFAERMFVSNHDALFTAILAVYAGVIGWWAGAMLATRALADVDVVRDGLRSVGDGARDVSFGTSGRDEIAELASAAAAMAAKLDGEETARRELVAAVSHDLRTPLTNLRLVADAVGDGLLPDADRDAYLGQLSVHVRQLGALIDDLFELSRLEAGDIHWSVEHVDLGGLVQETVDAMRTQAALNSIDVRTEFASGVGRAEANPEQLQRVLFNLIQNAVRHTPADGSVVVRATRCGTEVEIEVADTGVGIPAASRERVFDAFVRGDGARTTDGAGLGLAIARAIVEAHGGRIWLADADVGTRVRFTVPAAA